MRCCFVRSSGVFNWIRARRLERPRGRWLVSRVRDCGKGLAGCFEVGRGMGLVVDSGKWQRRAAPVPFSSRFHQFAGRKASPEMRKLAFPSRLNFFPSKISRRVSKPSDLSPPRLRLTLFCHSHGARSSFPAQTTSYNSANDTARRAHDAHVRRVFSHRIWKYAMINERSVCGRRICIHNARGINYVFNKF